jgi:Ca2+-binding RTX toxin-like protein
MATFTWSTLTPNQIVTFDPALDILQFDAGILSARDLGNWTFSGTEAIFTDNGGKTVTFSGLALNTVSTSNLVFVGSAARFFVGDLSAATTGDDLANSITGSAADDVFFGLGGSDTLIGGSGNDQFFALGGGNDTVNGGTGTDWYMAQSTATAGITVNLQTGRAYGFANGGTDTLISIEGVRGTMLADNLIGNAADNYFRGRAGDDRIFGRGGVDWVYYDEASAEGGIDVDLNYGIAYDDGFGGVDDLYQIENVRGGSFDDYIVGGYDDNVLSGQAGNDILVGGYGADTLHGGEGDDLLLGGYEDPDERDDYNDDYWYDGVFSGNIADYGDATGNLTLNLNLSTAQVTGGAGTDTLSKIQGLLGGAFDDTLTGTNNRNLLFGNAGNDSLYGGGGDDTFSGGAGDDLISGGAGNDTATYSYAGAAIIASLALTGPQNLGSSGTDTLVSIENLVGSVFNDSLTGNTGNNSLTGGAGNDTLSGGEGYDWLQGGHGNDILSGGNGLDTASYADALGAVTVNLNIAISQNTGGAGIDRLTSIENLEGSNFNDTLTAGSIASQLYGGEGNDLLIGGSGNDYLSGVNAGGNYDDYAQIDTVSYIGATGGVTVDLASNASQDVGGGQGIDVLYQIDNLIGSNFDDALTSSYNGSHVIEGRAGNDQLFTTSSRVHDTMDGGVGVDTLILNDYFNQGQGMTLNLSLVTAQLYGPLNDQGSLTVLGIENVQGSDFNDHLTGTSGNNLMQGMDGNDTLVGGAGVDTLSYSESDFTYDPFPMDYLGVTVSLALTTAQDTVSAGTDTVSGFENLIGSDWDDMLTGSTANNVIEGGQGNDTISGGAGFDTASYASSSGVTVSLAITVEQDTGGAGYDTLIGMEHLLGSAYGDALTGNAAANQLTGGLGSDVLTGGLGVDSFIYTSLLDSEVGSADTLTDFSAAQNDRINLSAIDANTLTAGNGAFSFIGNDVAFSGAGQLRFDSFTQTLQANVDADLGADMEIVLTGVSSLLATSLVL